VILLYSYWLMSGLVDTVRHLLIPWLGASA